jgi:signal transduction histidine kinase
VLTADVLPAVVAVGILIGGSHGAENHLSQHRTPLDSFGYAILAGAGAAFVLRRHLPLLLFVIETAIAAAYFGRGYTYGPIEVAVAVAAFVAAVRIRRNLAVVVGALSGVAMVVGNLIGNDDRSASGLLADLAQLAWPVVPTVVGVLFAAAREARHAAQSEAKLREVDEERLRLAREVHDVVGHGLSVISLQSGVALHLLDREPEAARAALEMIRRASTEALDELRTTLALARDEAVPRAPVSGLGRLPGLVTEVRLCGLPVDVRVDDGDGPSGLPQEVDQVAFRIVQEALTNSLRHSGASRAEVIVRHAPQAVQIVVDDDGQLAGTATTADGHGLVGLRERAAEVGGWCRAGLAPGGGWRVEAWLPFVRGTNPELR